MKYPSEADTQVAFLKWWRANKYPLIWHTPNGGGRTAREGAALKLQGVVRGVPDLFCPEWKLFIEMKREDGKPSKEQVDLSAYLAEVGYTVMFCFGLEHAKNSITSFTKTKTAD